MGLKRKTNTESMISPTVVTGAKIASFLSLKCLRIVKVNGLVGELLEAS